MGWLTDIELPQGSTVRRELDKRLTFQRGEGRSGVLVSSIIAMTLPSNTSIPKSRVPSSLSSCLPAPPKAAIMGAAGAIKTWMNHGSVPIRQLGSHSRSSDVNRKRNRERLAEIVLANARPPFEVQDAESGREDQTSSPDQVHQSRSRVDTKTLCAPTKARTSYCQPRKR